MKLKDLLPFLYVVGVIGSIMFAAVLLAPDWPEDELPDTGVINWEEEEWVADDDWTITVDTDTTVTWHFDSTPLSLSETCAQIAALPPGDAEAFETWVDNASMEINFLNILSCLYAQVPWWVRD